MLSVLLIGLQSVAGPPAPKTERLRVTRDCQPGTADSGDVVVCGRVDQDRHRLKPLPDRYEESPAIPRAEFAAGPGTLSAETEQVGVGGFPSNRIMLRFKMPF